MIERISTDKAPKAIGPYSQAVCMGSLIFTSGQIALDPDTGAVVGETIGVVLSFLVQWLG